MSVQTALVLFFAGGALLLDFQREKIPNSFICLAWSTGVLVCFFKRTEGLGELLGGICLPILCLIPLFRFHMLGAGDIKLFSALGGIMGSSEIFKLMGCSFLTGAIQSLGFLITCGNLKERIGYFLSYCCRWVRTGERQPYRKKGMEPENFHFTVPIFVGAMLYAGGLY